MQELISIIIPVYNVKTYLAECLQSVVAQTYRNLEIILVDDGSTDGSEQICDEWKAKDERIQVIHKENGGVSSARNKGLEIANGNYFGFVDPDDRIEPEMYEKLLAALGSADISACGYVEYPLGTLDVTKINGTRKTSPVGIVDAAVYFYERDGYSVSLCTKLFRRQVCFRDNKLIPMREYLHCGEDETWLAEVLQHCTTIAFLPEPLYHWLPRSGSATRLDRVTEKRLTGLEAKILAMEYLPKDDHVQKLAKARMFNDYYFLKAQSYYTGDLESYTIISSTLSPLKKTWLDSKDPTLLKRIKVKIMDLEMALHFPKQIVKMTDSFRRNGLKK